jgi:hypothetical protein
LKPGRPIIQKFGQSSKIEDSINDDTAEGWIKPSKIRKIKRKKNAILGLGINIDVIGMK